MYKEDSKSTTIEHKCFQSGPIFQEDMWRESGYEIVCKTSSSVQQRIFNRKTKPQRTVGYEIKCKQRIIKKGLYLCRTWAVQALLRRKFWLDWAEPARWNQTGTETEIRFTGSTRNISSWGRENTKKDQKACKLKQGCEFKPLFRMDSHYFWKLDPDPDPH